MGGAATKSGCGDNIKIWAHLVQGPDQISLPLQGRNSEMYQFKD